MLDLFIIVLAVALVLMLAALTVTAVAAFRFPTAYDSVHHLHRLWLFLLILLASFIPPSYPHQFPV